jgi:hypothetical protein
MAEVENRLARHFCDVFERRLVEQSTEPVLTTGAIIG